MTTLKREKYQIVWGGCFFCGSHPYRSSSIDLGKERERERERERESNEVDYIT